MNSQLEEINVILCQGRKTDGTQCKAEIQKKSKFCGKCRTKVDPQRFKSTVITCHGQGDDGSICGNIFDDEDESCTMCGTSRPKPVAMTELKMHSADRCSRDKEFPTVFNPAASLDSTCVASSSDQMTSTDASYMVRNQENETLELVNSDLQLNEDMQQGDIAEQHSDDEDGSNKNFRTIYSKN